MNRNSPRLLSPSKWRFAVDRGGTFTDVVGLDPSGNFHSLKLLSNSPYYGNASIEGIKRMLGLHKDEALPEKRIEGIRFGTTVATNALLERKGCRSALLITRGFSDALDIGYQSRPDIFSLCIKKSPPLYSAVIEVDERVDSRGRIIKECNAQALAGDIKRLRDLKVDAVSVVLMHSWANPEHELLCKQLLMEQGYSRVFLSHQTVNLIKIISRGQSTLVDTYLSTVLTEYMEGIKKETGNIPVEFMQSSGTLSHPGSFLGKNALFSGPAGGVVAVAAIAEEKEIKGIIGFDMGGTSTDVSRYDGTFAKRYEQNISGIPLQLEMLDIITVAAGGGSILRFDGQKMTVGPDSAGSSPGPACYGFRGPLTITDANLVTGKIVPDYFPKTFGPDRNSPVNSEVARQKLRILADEINRAMGTSLTPQVVAAGFLRIANEKMAMAIKEISVSRGLDIRQYGLVCFGGAGGQHACALAKLLDIERIFIHPLSGVLSAYGIGLTQASFKTESTVLKPYNERTHQELSGLFKAMEKQLSEKTQRGDRRYEIRRELDLRPSGADTFITVEYLSFDNTLTHFLEKYRNTFGFNLENTPLEVANVRMNIHESAEFFIPLTDEERTTAISSDPLLFQDIYYPEGSISAPVYKRESLPCNRKIPGPAIILDRNSTIVVDPDFEAEQDSSGAILITTIKKELSTVSVSKGTPDPVLLEVFNNIFTGVATEMGVTLKNTAYSVNIKERLDFSCAVFDAGGNLVANAPHIPVHLGAMADTVKALIQEKGNDMKAGDIYLTNNPYQGGSHLPDMTVICPVYSEAQKLIFFTAARGHHSDVGGKTPGSMPPSSRHIDEEGVLIDNFLLVRDGIFREKDLKEVLSTHRYPVRNIPERLYDFRAQIAACTKGKMDLNRLIKRYGLSVVQEYMNFIQENSEYSVKRALQGFLKSDNAFSSTFEDLLDDGSMLKVRISIDGGPAPPATLKATIDFSGTGLEHRSDNLNAPLSVVRSAVIYVLRTLIERDIPLNSGSLKPINIIVPEGTVLNPLYPSPVASGNVETSQRIVDVLLGAFGIAGASQGTMNNLLFEVDGESPYYETIAGGSGAVDGCPGASAVQVHMTNTRITDPEILEFRHPGVRLEQFTVRTGSGGKGKFPGGDGVIREIKFLKPSVVSIISERRRHAPYGIQGGKPGKRGMNHLRKADGGERELGHRDVVRVSENDSIVIKTPGGGGYGSIP